MGGGWAPSDGHGHDRGGYGRPGRDIELVAREDGQRASIRLLQKRTLCHPRHATTPVLRPPPPPLRGAPTSLPRRVLSPLPGERERERESCSTGLQPRDTTGQRDTLVYSINPSRVHARRRSGLVGDNSRGNGDNDRYRDTRCVFRAPRLTGVVCVSVTVWNRKSAGVIRGKSSMKRYTF